MKKRRKGVRKKMRYLDCYKKINKVLLNNVRRVLEKGSETDTVAVDKKIREVKQKIAELIEQGMNGFEQNPDVDTEIIEQGFLLKQLQEQRNKMLKNSKACERVKQIEEYIDNSVMNMKKIDNAMMRKMIERIVVHEDAMIDIHFKFGAVVHKQLEKAKVR